MLQVSHSQCPSLGQYDYQSSFSSSPIVLEISSSTFPPLSLGTYYAAVVPEFSLGSCFVNNTYFSIGACFGNNCTVLSPTTGTRNLFLKIHPFFKKEQPRVHTSPQQAPPPSLVPQVPPVFTSQVQPQLKFSCFSVPPPSFSFVREGMCTVKVVLMK